jgi:hypothetical protein
MTAQVRHVVAALAITLLALAHAQSFRTFTDGLFAGLEATDIECSYMGVNSDLTDFSRCGFIMDNLIAANKRIVERRFTNAGYTMLIPWRMDREETINKHAAGFAPTSGSGGFLYIFTYFEDGNNVSLVWVVANRR